MDKRPKVLIAPDKFKGTLDAEEAAGAIAAGVRAACPRAHISTLPVADGGEGTIEALLFAGGRAHDVHVQGPLGAPRSARFVTLGETAFIESAQACGLQLIRPDEGTAMSAHSFGVGELIRAALNLGCTEIIVGLGGWPAPMAAPGC